jgi:hypothetical protein
LTAGTFWGNGLAVAGDFKPPVKVADLLVLRSTNSSSIHILTINLGERRMARIRACEDLDQFGDCKGAWSTSQRMLTGEEFGALKRLSQEADLFGGRANGGHLDFSFRSLEVRSRNDIAMLVASLNDSFFEPGPRRELLLRLEKLDKEMATSASKRP